MNQPRGNHGRGTPNKGPNRARGRGGYRGRGRGRGGSIPASDSSMFVDASQPLFGGSGHGDITVINYNDMQSFDSISGPPKPKPKHGNFNNRGRGFQPRGQAQYRGNNTPARGYSTPNRGGKPRPYDADDVLLQQVSVQPPGSFKKTRGSGLGFHEIRSAIGEEQVPRGGRWDPATRPLLKPIKFVRAKERLFEANPEELLEAHRLPPHEADALDPQAERLAEVIEEVNEPERSRLLDNSGSSSDEVEAIDEVTINASVKVEKTMVDATNNTVTSNITAVEVSSKQEGFYFDSTPQQIQPLENIMYQIGQVTLGDPHEEDDEIILVPDNTIRKVPSSNASGLQIPLAPVIQLTPPTANAASLVFFEETKSTEVRTSASLSFSVPASSKRSPGTPLRARKEAKRTRKTTRDRIKRSKKPLFTQEVVPDNGSARVGDSDLEWGSDGPPGKVKEDEEDSGEEINGGMDVDPDFDNEAYAKMLGRVHEPHITIEEADDDSDGEGVPDPDGPFEPYESSSTSSNSESEDEDYSDEDDDDDEDEDFTPDRAWQQKLARMRERQGSIPPRDDLDEYETAADRTERTIAMLEELLMDQDTSGLTRKERKLLNRTVLESATELYDITPKHKKKLPLALQVQWERDRQKKAMRKQQREADRAKGLMKQKKSKKRSISLEEIEEIMRDMTKHERIGTVELPALDKDTRAKVHALALAFNLQSKSDNSKGGKRSETKVMRLSRTARTGRFINERKVAQLLGGGSYNGGASGKHKLKEGEIVGHKAEKISQENRGFKLLAKMGWSEGDRIGIEGGLDVPLTAVMKKTKLGLGAATFEY